jgi:hypothetical protein
MMSCRRKAGRSEGNGAVLIDFLLKAPVTDWFLNHIHRAAENFREALLQTLQAFDEAEASTGRVFGKSHRNINIVSWNLIPCHRPKQGETSNSVCPEFRFVVTQHLNGLISIHQLIFPPTPLPS